MPTTDSGLYIHIPFCLNKCPYCDFFSITDLSLISPFVDALIAEMRLKREAALPFDTLYIGGGTPSILSAQQIDRIIQAAHQAFDIRSGAEITLEVNPGTVKTRQLQDYRAVGVNRLNIGVQSFSDRHLDFLGRIHTGRQGRLAVESAQKAGFDHIGMDLICGIPGQTRKSWLSDLAQAADLCPEHLSCYLLTIEPGTPMAADLKAGRFETLSETAVAGLFEATQWVLHSRGYTQYEISNFARSESTRSRHNHKYWTFAPYDGLGPAAHSFRSPVRWWNHRSVAKYLQDIEAGKVPVAGKEILGREQQIIETIYLGLRTAEGIDIKDFKQRFHTDFSAWFAEPVTALTSEGMLESTPDRCVLTEKGMRFHEGIAKLFIEYVPSDP